MNTYLLVFANSNLRTYNIMKLSYEKWDGTQKHENTEFYSLLKEQSSQKMPDSIVYFFFPFILRISMPLCSIIKSKFIAD